MPLYELEKALAPPKLDFTEPLKEVRDIIRRETLDNFLGQHDPDGIPWAEWSESTRRRNREPRKGRLTGHASRSRILFETGALEGSFGDVDELSSTRLRWGTDDHVAAFHQTADDGIRDAHHMPERPMIGINDRMEAEIEEIVANYVESQWGRP